MIRRNLGIPPILTELPCLLVRFIVNWDMALPPYQPLFFQLGEARDERGPKNCNWGRCPKSRTSRLTFVCPVGLKAAFNRCAALHAPVHGEMVDAVRPVPAHARSVHGRGSAVQEGSGGYNSPKEANAIAVSEQLRKCRHS